MYQRNGLRMADLGEAQRAAVMSLLSAALSARRLSQGQRDHERRRSAANPAGRRRRPRRPRTGRGRRPDVRQGSSTSRVPRHAVGDRAVDAAVRRPPPGDQSHDGRQPGDDGAEPAGRAAGDLHHRGADDPSARQGERQGVRADQRAGREAARPGDPQLSRRRSRARPGQGRADDPAGRHSRLGALGRRSRRCCGTSCASGRASCTTRSPSRAWRRSAPASTTPGSPGAAPRPTAARRTSGSRGRRW